MSTTPVVSFPVRCSCLCGETVTAYDEGFSSTTVEVDACSTLRARGIVSVTVRKSAAYAAAVPTSAVRHRDGLVAFEVA